MPCAWREEWVWKEMEDSMKKKKDLALICDVEHKVIAMSIFFIRSAFSSIESDDVTEATIKLNFPVSKIIRICKFGK